MKFAIAGLLAAVHVVSVHSVSSHFAASRGKGRNEHPVEGVITLLKNLRQQAVEEGQAEEVTYAKFAKWCADSERTLQKAVTAGEESIDSLKDEEASLTAENTTLTDQLANLAEEILKYEGADSDSEQARQDENQRYTAADQDFASTIQAFQDAIGALQDAQPSSSSALVQELLGKVPAMALGRLSDSQMSLLMEAGTNSTNSSDDRPDLLAQGGYGKHTKKYTFKSGNVVELLKALKASFEDQRVEATKAETNAANAYNLAKDARDKALQAARTAHSEKTDELSACQQTLNTVQGELSDAEGDLQADKSTLSDTKRDCNMKKTEWEERSSIREREIKAIDAGVKVLAKVSGVRTEAPTNPILPAPPTDEAESGGFMQEAAILWSLQTDPRARAVGLLKSEATRLHSKSFQRFAAEVEAKVAGPFDEVDNMITKMIFRLMAEQKDEDDHKNWCDLELDKTNASKQDKEDKLSELGLKITAAQSSVAELTQQIQDATGMVAKIDSFIEEATATRAAGKKENKAAIADAKAAQEAIAKAIAVLEEFYKSSGMIAKEAWEFVQKGSAPVTLPSNPATWDSAYTGVADPKSQPDGVVAVLESIASDFSTMQASTMAQEATDEKNYQEEMQAQQIEKARRSKEAEMKNQERQRLQEKVATLEKSKKHTQQEKEATEQYLKDLEPACVDGDSTYDERKAARDDEIGALKEAQVILADAFEGNSTSGNSTSGNSSLLETQELPGGRSFLAPVRPAH